jgi:hypothetical protein
MPWQPSSLETFWNMYDALGVWTTYGAGQPPQANISRDNLTRVGGWCTSPHAHALLPPCHTWCTARWVQSDHIQLGQAVQPGRGVASSTDAHTPYRPPLQVQQLANWLETSKMRSSMAGNLLGGALLGDMLHWLQQAVVGIRTGEVGSDAV